MTTVLSELELAPRLAQRAIESGPSGIAFRPAVFLALMSFSAWFPTEVRAQGAPAIEVVFSSPPSPVGAGARAVGMGSAFIGLADDATAASWNPGGLTQLERPEMSAVGRFNYQTTTLGSGSVTEIVNDLEQTTSADGETDSFSTVSLDFLSAAIPFEIAGRNVVASLNYQQLYSFDRDLHYTLGNESPCCTFTSVRHLREEGGIDAVTAAFAIDATPNFAIGTAINYWIDGITHPFAWRERFEENSSLEIIDVPTIEYQARQQYTFKNVSAVNASFGFLWKLPENFSLGFVAKLPATSDVDQIIQFQDNPDAEPLRTQFEIHFPATYGVGLSWRPSDRFTLSGDVTYVDWGDFRVTNAAGEEFLVTGDPADSASVYAVVTPRIGAEYVWELEGARLATRAGAFMDPEPSRDGPEPFYGGSVGLGLTLASTNIDLAYSLRVGLDAKNTSTATQLFNVPDVSMDQHQHQFYFSVVQYF